MKEDSLFAAALDITNPAQRRAFLDEACAGDVQLRARLEQLLAADEQPTIRGNFADIHNSPIPKNRRRLEQGSRARRSEGRGW